MPPKSTPPKTEPTLADSYRIFGVQVDSFMRLKSANVRFDSEGHVAVISGDNEQGKTSFLQAIWTALGGVKVTPGQPVHRGADQAEIVLDLVPTDDPVFESDRRIRVIRTVTADGKWSLKLWAEGRSNPFKSPQALLEEFFNALSFDPSEFLRMKPEKQSAVLVAMGGVEERVAALKAEKEAVYAERTGVNALVRNAQARLDRLPQPAPGAKTEVTSATELTKRLNDARQTVTANQAKRDELTQLRADFAQVGIDIAAKEERIAELQQELAALVEKKAGLLATGKTLKAEVDALVDPDVTTLEQQVDDLEAANETARKASEHAAAKAEVADEQKKADALTARIDEFDARIGEVLAGASYPVPDLAVTPEGAVLFDGLPFEQASSARRLEVSLAMGAALHPKLRFLALQEASMMTETTRDRVEAWAREHGYFVLMELATRERIGIHIEDGEVVAA